MIDTDTLNKLKTASIEERIETIELILKSVKEDLHRPKPSPKPFKVRPVSLGEDIQVNREEIYGERGA
jgi:hypothetical protein